MGRRERGKLSTTQVAIPKTIEEARTYTESLPYRVLEDAQKSLNRINEEFLPTDSKAAVELVQPIHRVMGWAEGLIFAFGQVGPGTAMKLPNGRSKV